MITTLDQLPFDIQAQVVKVNTQGEVGRRLVEMGIIKGASLKSIRVAPLGDPLEITLRGFHLSLRKSEAARITVEVKD